MAADALTVAIGTLTARVEELARHVAVLSQRVPLRADELSTEEATALYGVSRSTLYDLARRELLTVVKRPGRRGSWWRRAELESWLRGCPEPRRRGHALARKGR